MTGTLIAIGGAIRLDGEVLASFYQRSGGAGANIIILPTASTRPESGLEYASALTKLGLQRPACVLPVRQRADCSREDFLEKLREASGIFLTGGSPLRLSAILGGTMIHQELLTMHRNGIVIGGSSAGAAVLSTLMIAHGNSGSIPRQRIAEFSPGLGFINDIIFDQHYRQRNRLGRLLYAVASNPSLFGVGLDEDTAAIIDGDVLTVAGSSAVTIIDGSTITQCDIAEIKRNKVIAVSGVKMHILSHGCTFNLRERAATIPDPQINGE